LNSQFIRHLTAAPLEPASLGACLRYDAAMRADSTPGAAILFDFDGVLVEDEWLHWRALRDVLGRLGIPLPRARYDARYLALDDNAACRAALEDAGWPRTGRPALVALLVRRKRRLFRRLCVRHRLGVSFGARRVVRVLSARMPLAVVSGAARVEIVGALKKAGLLRRFETIVAAEDVRRCKPSPEGYRTALRRLRLAAGPACIAVEDSPGGIAAARAAGLRTLGVASSYGPRALRRAGAFEVVRSLDAPATALRILLSATRRR
jgi:beta-phosphoglucomutase